MASKMQKQSQLLKKKCHETRQLLLNATQGGGLEVAMQKKT